jgi:hypothetical protein
MFDVCVVLGSAFLAIRTIHTVSVALSHTTSLPRDPSPRNPPCALPPLSRHVARPQVVAREENSAKSKIAAVVSLQVMVVVIMVVVIMVVVVVVVDDLW